MDVARLGKDGVSQKPSSNIENQDANSAHERIVMNSRLLVAESDVSLCDIYRQFFSIQGFQVATAAHGLECLVKIREFMPDVLVLEWEIPWEGRLK
jgi:hypothetical protein